MENITGKYEQIKKEISGLPFDIKAEVIIAQLLSAGLQWAQLAVHPDDFFSRRFDKDITHIEEVAAHTHEILHVHISRSGLYDLLPEGIFFLSAADDKVPRNANEMAIEYRKNKERETETRKFFLPFENEFFYHRYKNFFAEVSLLHGLQDKKLNSYFIRFWNLPEDIQQEMAIRLIMLLPYVHQVAGDADLMASCLQTIIDKKVSCSVITEQVHDTGMDCNELGLLQLGNGLTCGNEYIEEEYNFLFTIYPDSEDKLTDYLAGGKLHIVLETFSRFFLPAQAGLKTEIRLPADKMRMHLGSETGSRLGIAALI